MSYEVRVTQVKNVKDGSMSKIKVATLQGRWTGDFDSNNAWYVEQARALKGKGYDLVVLPELFHTPYFPFEENADFFDLAIEKDSGSPSRRN